MSTLHDRLVDLAADAPAAAPDPLLWDRAARSHRRRRAGTAALAAVAVLAVLSLVGIDAWQRSPGVEPAAPGSEPALPSRVWEPSGWLPGNDGEPTGPLALLQPRQRAGWTGSEDGVVGVSATTGEYRFLDLSDDAGHGWALSPDGTKVAYWLTGETSGSPQTSGGQELPVVGVGVWDTRTGEVLRHEVVTEHGLALYEDPVWADATTLVLSWGEHRVGDDAPTRLQGGSIDEVGLRAWDVTEDRGPRPLGLPRASVDVSNADGKVLLQGARRPVLDVETGTRTDLPVFRVGLLHVSALSPDGAAVAYPRGNRNPAPLVVTRSTDGDRGGTVVLEEKIWAAVGWVDEDTIAFVTRDTEQDPIPATIETVSLSTGERETLVEAGSFQPLPTLVATDLLAVEPRDFPEPSSPWDPRVVAGLVLFVTLVAGLCAWGWRRRVEV